MVKALLLMMQLMQIAKESNILPLSKTNSLVSIVKLVDSGFTTILYPNDRGVMVHGPGDIEISIFKSVLLQRWQDSSGLWHVPLVTKVTNFNTDMIIIKCPTPMQAINNA